MKGNSQNKEVRFDIWCKQCRYREHMEKLDPCNDCLEIGMREGTEVPERFEKK